MPILGAACFQLKSIDKNRKYSKMKILQCIQNDVVFNFNDVIIIACCALITESTQYVAILKFEWILYVTKRKNTKQFYFVILKMLGLKYPDSNNSIIL